MKNKFILLAVVFCMAFALQTTAQENGYKTTIDVTVDKVGSAICEYKTKYNAAYWDNFTKTIGTNTSILKNMLIRQFPKQQLSDFKYSQNADDKTNDITFRINGMMNLNKDGKWEADLEQKDPDITKLSNTEFLLIASGNTMKIHLPEGTTDAKVEKNSFGKAMLTFPATEGGGAGNVLTYAGILCVLAGGVFLFLNMRKNQSAATPAYKKEMGPVVSPNIASKEISNN